ncbi:AzlC family ABC transporter permease [Sulfitobacter sp. LCG007]
MSSTTSKPAYWKGVRHGAPFILMVAPFALLFGVFAVESGLNIIETITFSVAVFAGASQFTALQMMQENAPTLVVLISALAVNLRLVMYSASLTPYLGSAGPWQRALVAYFTVDQSYACSLQEFELNPQMTLQQRLAYFTGVLTPIVPVWYGATLLGALAGARIPEEWTIDFALPICFLAMVAPLLRTPAHIVAALTAAGISLFAAAVPYSLGLVVAGLAGMIAGAQTELWMARRGEQRA